MSSLRHALKSRTNAALEMLVVHGFAEIADDPILQGSVPDNLIRVCGDEYRWDMMSRMN
jgi:hypothetical protein